MGLGGNILSNGWEGAKEPGVPISLFNGEPRSYLEFPNYLIVFRPSHLETGTVWKQITLRLRLSKKKKYDYVSIGVQSAVFATKRVRRDFFFHSRVRPTSGTSINLFTRSSFGLGSNHHKALQKPALNMSRNQKLKIFSDG